MDRADLPLVRAGPWLSDAVLLAAIRPGPGVRYHCVPMSPRSDDVTRHNAPVIHHKCISGWSNLVILSSTSLYLRNLRSGHLASQVQFIYCSVLFTLGINESIHSLTRQCLVTTLDIHLIETVVTLSCRCHAPVTWPGVGRCCRCECHAETELWPGDWWLQARPLCSHSTLCPGPGRTHTT